MRRRIAIFAVLLLAGSAPAYAQDVGVRATVDQTVIGTEERLVYNVQVEGASPGDVQTPSAPESSGLVLVQRTPGMRRNVSIVNGVIRQSISFQWTYRPVREGSARIEATHVTIGDDTFATDPIQIEVVPQSQRPSRSASRQQWPFVVPSTPPSDDGDDVSSRDLFIRAVPSANTARQNEQITIEYQLFFRDGIQLRHSRLAGSWDAEGFWREEFNVDSRPIPRNIVENGVRYHMIVLKRVAVFPTRPGTLTVDPLEIETEAYLPSRASDPFERFFSRSQFETIELASEPVRLRIEPLPPDAPDSFAGAVGSFELDAAIDKTRLEVGEPLEVTVRVRGTGNLATLDAPEFEAPGTFERYDPRVQSTIDRDSRLIQGTKTFRYVLIPRSNGSFELPPVTLSYFDPEQSRYVTTRAPLPATAVTGSAATFVGGTTADGMPVDDIATIMAAAEAWHHLESRPLYRRPWPLAALAAPIGFLLLLYGYQRWTERFVGDTRLARSRMAHPLARKHLREAQTMLAQERPRAFYEEIERAVTGFVGHRLNIPGKGLTREQLDARLADVGVPPEDRRLLRRLLDECDQARFAPILPDRAAMQSAGERAAHIIVTVDEAVEKYETETASV